MNYFANLWAKEPARVIGVAVVLLDAGLIIATGYGLHVPDVVHVQVDVVGSAFITLVGAEGIRTQVTPVASLPKTP